MRAATSLVAFVTGMISVAILSLSCSDNSVNNVDAATCDCPAAEPPLASRIMVVSQTADIPANDRGGTGAKCPQGALRLEGSCTTVDINPDRAITLEQAGFYQPNDLGGWECKFKNNEAVPVTVKASVVCLMPPSQ
jgi:hypothetical protein